MHLVELSVGQLDKYVSERVGLNLLSLRTHTKTRYYRGTDHLTTGYKYNSIHSTHDILLGMCSRLITTK